MLFGIVIFLLSSCDKDNLTTEYETQKEMNLSNIANTRTSSQNDWARNFQSYLQDLDNGVSTSTNYTLEEATYGLEWLFNYSYADVKSGVNIKGINASFDIPANNDWLALYTEIYTHLEGNQFTDFHLDYISVDVNPETNQVDVYSNYKLSNSEIIEYFSAPENEAFNCSNPPFTDDEFILGLGGQNGGREIFFPCNELPSCGEGGACATPNITALEIIEGVQNNQIRSNHLCKDGGVPAFTNIGFIYIRETELLSIASGCSEVSKEESADLGGCACIVTDMLNCVFCYSQNLLSNSEVTNQIPEGSEIINIDLHVNYVNQFNLGQWYSATITYGEVNCIEDPRDNEPPILTVICC